MEKLRELKRNLSLGPDDNLTIVSFELPLSVKRITERTSDPPKPADYQVNPTNSLLLPGLHDLRSSLKCSVTFVGYCGMTTDDEAEREVLRKVLSAFDCRPVFPPTQQAFDDYVSFCYRFLLPLFHSIVHVDAKLQEPFSQHYWVAYQTMNKLWAQEVSANYSSESDLIWVHDYHLLLVPQYVSRMYKRANIGFFLHSPFPPPDIFRCCPVRNEILRALLASDLVGFHLFDYANHFLTSCKRALGIDHYLALGGFMGLDYAGRRVTVKIGHVTVEYNALRSELSERRDVREMADTIRRAYEGKFIFGAVDRCDQLAGLLLKLKALRLFLREFSYARNRLVLIQYAYPTKASPTGGMKMAEELHQLAMEINSEFGLHIVLKIQPIRREEKWAVLMASDCLLDTSIRDGLNLIAYEYIACREMPSRIILSTFIGCASTLACPQQVNPWLLEGVATAMDIAISAPIDSSHVEKWTRDQMYLSQHSLKNWVIDFLGDLQRARKEGNKVYMQYGFASTFKVVSLNEDFRPLPVSTVVRAYRRADKLRLLFLDHEGTLAPDKSHLTVAAARQDALSSSGTPPSLIVRDALSTLCEDRMNRVVIFSGRNKQLLEAWFGDIENLSLCAEHGYYLKFPNKGDEWQCLAPSEDLTWKQMAHELMGEYVKRTQGSFIENKGSALVFQYRDADPDFGAWQAKELAMYLEEFMFSLPVSIVCGKGYVEARLKGVSKGNTAQHLISLIGESPSFILGIGDDRSDEEMLSVVNGLCNNDKCAAFSVTVGKKPSNAKYFLNDTDEVSELLKSLCGSSGGSSSDNGLLGLTSGERSLDTPNWMTACL